MISADFLVEATAQGQRLDHFLAARLSTLSRARIQDLIRTGFIMLKGEAAKPSLRVKTGDLVTVREPAPQPTETAPEEIPLHVLFEDEDLIVLDKPAGLVVHPAAGHSSGTLVNALLHHCGSLSSISGEQRPGIVHRLDKETSGCLVAAKNDATHQDLQRQFAGREVRKIYLALAGGGHFRERAGEIAAPIGRHPVQRKKMSVVAADQGRAARTSYRVLRELECGTLVECTLHTGRTHQIRVHLQHLGHALLGDALYGKRAGFSRQMLHAWQLGFRHPQTRALVNFRSPVPLDFVQTGVAADLS